jgi:small-conductance mechanosensitive channel
VLLAFSIYTAAQYLSLPNRIERFMHPTAKLILLWQVGLWGSAAVTFWIRHYMERRTDSNDRASVTMISAIGVGGKIILWVLITVTALQSVFGIAITPVLTTLGVGGVAVALAVQNILGDLLAALAIVFDQPFDVGDYIVVGDVSGNVERIGLKTTRVRSISGEQVILGNADLLKSRLRNFRRLYQRRVLFNIDVMIDTPTEKLERLPGTIQEIIQAQSPVKFDRSHVLGLTDSAVRIESVYYVLDPEYSVHMNIQQAVQLEIFRRLAAENIRIAYPSRTVFVEQGAERIL